MQPASSPPASPATMADRRTSVSLPLRVRGARRGAPYGSLLAGELLAHALEQPEEQRHKKDGDAGREQHAANHTGADGAQAVRARAGGDGERHAAENERK